MRIGLIVLIVVACAPAVFAQQNRTGTCTTAVTLNTSTPSQIFPFQDVSGGRHYFMIQCNGTGSCSCAIATGANAANPPGVTATNGVVIGSGGNSWIMIASPGVSIPVGEADCIAVSGSPVAVACDW